MTVRFGPCELDAARRQLLREGREVHLTPKAFELLTLLVDTAPRVVKKAELHQRLWPNGIVSDAMLVGLVKEIRRALDDRDKNAPLIRTVHRVGYAFAAAGARGLRPSSVSRWLIAGERRIVLVDGDKNGTTIGGAKLAAAVELRNGDRFSCGQVLLVYRESRAGLPTATHVSVTDEATGRR